jgi:hypothetical protein
MDVLVWMPEVHELSPEDLSSHPDAPERYVTSTSHCLYTHLPSQSMLPEIGASESALLTDIAMCVNYYRLFSPGLYCCVHAPLQLDEQTFFRPGIIVMVNHGELKQCDPGPDYDCFHGPPNFVLDVFPGHDLQDYEERRSAFERTGVLEYVAVRHRDPDAGRRIHHELRAAWFVDSGGRIQAARLVGRDGSHCARRFTGWSPWFHGDDLETERASTMTVFWRDSLKQAVCAEPESDVLCPIQ